MASAASSQAPATAVATVRATFTAAITAVTSFGAPPAAYRMTVLSAIGMRQSVPGFSAALASDLRASGTAAIARYFGPPQAMAERRELTRAMALDAGSGTINLGSGLTRLSFAAVHVQGDTATVSAVATAWSRSEARQPVTGSWLAAARVRVTGYTATLARSLGGSWRITGLTARPGRH
jgi:hypothetical protein